MAERVAEDRRALAHLGIEPRNLGFLDAQYRDGTPLAAAELEAALEGFVAAAEAVHAPAGLGDHADHVAVREAALALAARSGAPVFLYAEQPYATRFGWPSWVTGAESTAELDPGVDWERDLANVSVGPDRLRPDAVRLPAEEAARKVHAMREYATQLPALDAVGGVSLLEVSGWEVRWELTSPNR
jgi:LmbE family N-acetylglucosaminyl deacetylase